MSKRVPSLNYFTTSLTAGSNCLGPSSSPLAFQYFQLETTNQSDASTVLYCGSSPASGNTFGIIPLSQYWANVSKILRATSNCSDVSVSPGSAIIVSRPQSVNHG